MLHKKCILSIKRQPTGFERSKAIFSEPDWSNELEANQLAGLGPNLPTWDDKNNIFGLKLYSKLTEMARYLDLDLVRAVTLLVYCTSTLSRWRCMLPKLQLSIQYQSFYELQYTNGSNWHDFMSMHSDISCSGAFSSSWENLHSSASSRPRLARCFRRRQCPLRKPVRILSFFLLKSRHIFDYSWLKFPRNVLEYPNSGSLSHSDALSDSSFVSSFSFRVSLPKQSNCSAPIKKFASLMTYLFPSIQ